MISSAPGLPLPYRATSRKTSVGTKTVLKRDRSRGSASILARAINGVEFETIFMGSRGPYLLSAGYPSPLRVTPFRERRKCPKARFSFPKQSPAISFRPLHRARELRLRSGGFLRVGELLRLQFAKDFPECRAVTLPLGCGVRRERNAAAGEKIKELRLFHAQKLSRASGRKTAAAEKLEHRLLFHKGQEILFPKSLIEEGLRDRPLQPRLRSPFASAHTRIIPADLVHPAEALCESRARRLQARPPGV